MVRAEGFHGALSGLFISISIDARRRCQPRVDRRHGQLLCKIIKVSNVFHLNDARIVLLVQSVYHTEHASKRHTDRPVIALDRLDDCRLDAEIAIDRVKQSR
jgi:hypothetical protein